MSQRVDSAEQRSYQDAYEYRQPVYQGQQPVPGNHPGMVGWVVGQAGKGESVSPAHRLAVAICSLAALPIVVFALVASIRPDYSGFTTLAVLISLGLVCATIVAINLAINLKH